MKERIGKYITIAIITTVVVVAGLGIEHWIACLLAISYLEGGE